VVRSSRRSGLQSARSFEARAGDRCEQCGVHHLAYGVRIDGEFTDLGLNKDDAVIEYEYAKGIAGMFAENLADLSRIPPLMRIVCTVAHLDHGLTDHSSANCAFGARSAITGMTPIEVSQRSAHSQGKGRSRHRGLAGVSDLMPRALPLEFRTTRPKRDDEEQLHRAVWEQFLWRREKYVVGFHCPNEGKRSKASAGRLKALGVVPGVFDLIFFVPP